MDSAALLFALVVRLYDSGALADDDRRAAIATASAILEASDIGTTWPLCQPPKPRPTPAIGWPDSPVGLTCNRPIGAGELAIHLVRGQTPREARGRLPLGYALVDTQRRAGALATIYLDRVDWLAAASGVDARILLGRALAHEIGHLLLGTSEHGRTGLMRAVWSRSALQRHRPGDWRFTRSETHAIQRSLRGPAPAAVRTENIVWGSDAQRSDLAN